MSSSSIVAFPGMANRIAALSFMSDTDHAAAPQALRDLSAVLFTVLDDEAGTTSEAARATALPEQVVADFRRLVGI